MILGDFGADVIKVEHPEYRDALEDSDNYSEYLSCYLINSNKKVVTIDLHYKEDQAVFKHLIENADILIEGFGPGTL